MALADYRLCDVCDGKAFYDSNLNYEFRYRATDLSDWTDAEKDRGYQLDYLGDWKVLCAECSKTHKCVVVPIDPTPPCTNLRDSPNDH
jgi:hypothetical protein